MRFWKNSCGCGKPLVLDHNIRSHWIATLEVEGKANLSKLKKGGASPCKMQCIWQEEFCRK
jgi:hypothetical protein